MHNTCAPRPATRDHSAEHARLDALLHAIDRTRSILLELAGSLDAIDRAVYEDAIADLILREHISRERDAAWESARRSAAGAAVLFFAGELIRGSEADRFARFDTSTMRWLDHLDAATPKTFELRLLSLSKLAPLRAAIGETISCARALNTNGAVQ